MKSKNSKTALVTGASSGIGKAFAEELAADGFNLVLVARRIDRINSLKADLEAAHGIKALVIEADLFDPQSPTKIFNRTVKEGVSIDILINSAGFGCPEEYLELPWQKHADFIQVMVTAVCQLTHAFLPGMVERGYGRIINVSSLSGLLPGSLGHTLYGPAKSFLIKMSDSLTLELKGKGINVTALCPGFTYSEYHDVCGMREVVSKSSRLMWSDAKSVARDGIKAVMSGKPVYVPGTTNKFIAVLAKYLPSPLLKIIASQQNSLLHRPEHS